MAAFSSGSKSARRGARSNMGGHPSSGVAGKAGAYSSRDPQSLGRPDPCSLPLVAGRRFGSPLLGTAEPQTGLADEVLLKPARHLRLGGRQNEKTAPGGRHGFYHQAAN